VTSQAGIAYEGQLLRDFTSQIMTGLLAPEQAAIMVAHHPNGTGEQGGAAAPGLDVPSLCGAEVQAVSLSVRGRLGLSLGRIVASALRRKIFKISADFAFQAYPPAIMPGSFKNSCPPCDSRRRPAADQRAERVVGNDAALGLYLQPWHA
jgi:hypothetical protein